MLIEAAENNLRIVEVEITVRYDVNTTTANPVVQGLTVLLRVLELMRFNRPLYYYGISGAIIMFFGILIYFTLKSTLYSTNIYLMSVSVFVMLMGFVLIMSGLFTEYLNRFKK